MTPNEIAQTENTTDAFNAIYQDAEMMLAWLAAAPTTRDRWARAWHCRAIALQPQGRFGLSGRTTDTVLYAIDGFIRALECAVVADVAREVRELYAEHQAWDTTWALADLAAAHGFGPGDSKLLEEVTL